MTDQELKELVASLAAFHKEARGEIRELRAAQRETDRQLKATDLQLKETDQQLKESIEEARLRSKETDRQIKELGKQIGGLGRKFGGLTEGMAYPSMKKLLRERFHMEFIVPRVEITRNGKNMELDVFGYSNGSLNRAVVVEVKSRLDQEGIEQMDRIMARFDEFLPEHSDKRRFGIVAAVDCSPEMKNQVRQRGFYLARIQDELFVLDSPESFRPRYFGCV
uniref:DUF8196 domain-containing protein n=1 Tax=Candidatus Kentrum sp. SD TaxID=2126332 RepID=A0A451BPN2_9GAMM|nr:MAG: hypothetical protein BECKSD772F_GA0070984_11353 [Candidatus Kentron sp. SD]VFK48187.1 MAG: hypothetical protein BECKSD772E_GA0070983_11163 [Candidatus Kentron sp. SD]VFK80207.1 MAG: hypothetical protein BECKSD772D_GA0070982_10931 [Candidatus Kentron sp. SD]